MREPEPGTPAPIRVGLELEPGVEPITGRLIDATGASSPFCGWLDLADALSALAGRPERPAARDAP